MHTVEVVIGTVVAGVGSVVGGGTVVRTVVGVAAGGTVVTAGLSVVDVAAGEVGADAGETAVVGTVGAPCLDGGADPRTVRDVVGTVVEVAGAAAPPSVVVVASVPGDVPGVAGASVLVVDAAWAT